MMTEELRVKQICYWRAMTKEQIEEARQLMEVAHALLAGVEPEGTLPDALVDHRAWPQPRRHL